MSKDLITIQLPFRNKEEGGTRARSECTRTSYYELSAMAAAKEICMDAAIEAVL